MPPKARLADKKHVALIRSMAAAVKKRAAEAKKKAKAVVPKVPRVARPPATKRGSGGGGCNCGV